MAAFTVCCRSPNDGRRLINLRKYIDEMEAKRIADPAWLTWAGEKANAYDPFSSIRQV